jgi:nitrite reductase/ring-hydroxylating ferredoxin subunit
MSRQRLANADALSEGEAVKFQFQRDGLSLEGFVIRIGGKIIAYENRCRHLPLSLDYGDGRFFTRDAQHLICQSHGALYEPLTGLCVRGPCEGASLRPLPVREEAGAIWLVP